jgi:hypothetical protein
MYKDGFVAAIMNTGEYRPHFAAPSFELAGKAFVFGFVTKDDCKLAFDGTTLEHNGKKYDYTCVKCEDKAYLVGFDGKSLFIDTAANRAVLVSGDKLLVSGAEDDKEKSALTEELAGWKTSLCFAPGLSVTCEFGKGTISYEGGKLDTECVKVRDAMYIVKAATADGSLTLVLDTSRFLFYGFLDGKTGVGGYIENFLD